MGSYESIHNNSEQPVEVWWQNLGGGAPAGGYDDQILYPGLSTTAHKFSLSEAHQICVKYGNKPGERMCKESFSPALADSHKTIDVTDVVAPQGEELSALPGTSEAGYAVPVFALATFVGALIGFKTFRSYQKRQVPVEALG